MQIETPLFEGIARKRLKLIYNRNETPPGLPAIWDTTYWVHGIGALQHPFYAIQCLPDYCEGRYRLLCADSSNTQVYRDTVFNTCDSTFILGNTDLSDQRPFELYPNPFTDNFKIVSHIGDSFKFKILSLQGVIVAESELNSDRTIFESGNILTPGVYIIELKVNNRLYKQKLIKLE